MPSLCNLKSLEIELESLQMGLPDILMESMLRKVAAKSLKKAAKLRKAFEEGWRPQLIPNGMVDFLLQNSPTAKLEISSVWD